MYLTSGPASEIRQTLEAAVEITNAQGEPGVDLRSILSDYGFSRAAHASQASVDRLRRRMEGLAPLLRALADVDIGTARARVNEELTELHVVPSIAAHDGIAPHLHWTPPTATFDDQVVTDVFMALAQDLCGDGPVRFGRCGAEHCDRLFYDTTRNRSRRFCSDARCASRTHTAGHRLRQRTDR